jgi:Skp family chaperone for outer membrane proteins
VLAKLLREQWPVLLVDALALAAAVGLFFVFGPAKFVTWPLSLASLAGGVIAHVKVGRILRTVESQGADLTEARAEQTRHATELTKARAEQARLAADLSEAQADLAHTQSLQHIGLRREFK